jgi:hypothetical protein
VILRYFETPSNIKKVKIFLQVFLQGYVNQGGVVQNGHNIARGRLQITSCEGGDYSGERREG